MYEVFCREFTDLNMRSEVHLSFITVNLLKQTLSCSVYINLKHIGSVSKCFILDNMFISCIKAFLVYAFHGRDVFKMNK